MEQTKRVGILSKKVDEAAEKYGREYTILPDYYNDGEIDFYAEETGRAFKAGACFAVQRIIFIIESRIAEILGDAQPAPILRIELQELIDKIKEESK